MRSTSSAPQQVECLPTSACGSSPLAGARPPWGARSMAKIENLLRFPNEKASSKHSTENDDGTCLVCEIRKFSGLGLLPRPKRCIVVGARLGAGGCPMKGTFFGIVIALVGLAWPALPAGAQEDKAGIAAAVNPQATGQPPNEKTQVLRIGQNVIRNERNSPRRTRAKSSSSSSTARRSPWARTRKSSSTSSCTTPKSKSAA